MAATPTTASNKAISKSGAITMTLLILLIGTVMIIRHEWRKSGLSKVRVFTPLHLTPVDRCKGWLILDRQRVGDFSGVTDEVTPTILPGSTTNPCFGTLITPPTNWPDWEGHFNDPDPAGDDCVAWVQYEGVSQTYPFFGDRIIGFNKDHIPGHRWRIASNCPIVYYKR